MRACPDGETGRRSRLKICRPRGFPGSIPGPGTILEEGDPLTAPPDPTQARIGVIGLGYVGLPLAAAFGRSHDTVGFDIDAQRVDELRVGIDRTRETQADELAAAVHLRYTANADDLGDRNVYIVTVPTPIDALQRPDLRPLQDASALLSKLIAPGDLVIYESTVYPGTTEEICVPILEAGSGLRFNVDFYCGYSPERINPGDRTRRLADIPKVTSGSTPEVAAVVDALYAGIVTAGTHRAPSLRVAEAAKVVENIQRDVNIGLINELAMMFDRLGIDTLDVLEAAGTKWNFLPFRPGLVGGHCIGVDPYYLTHKSESVGYHPELILADEPFSALDALTRIRMQRLLLDLCARHRPAVLFVTHDVEEALSLADRVVMIADGHIAYDEDVSNVRLSADAFLQARARVPDLQLILAPRHPRRGDEVAAMIRARGLKPRAFALSSSIHSTAAAPSEICDEVPAVWMPPTSPRCCCACICAGPRAAAGRPRSWRPAAATWPASSRPRSRSRGRTPMAG